jgi:DNA-binding beta-propeller fold protein YncE
MKLAAVFLVLATLCTNAAEASTARPAAWFVLERTMALKSVRGRIDHLAVDLGRKRLFAAELDNGTVDAIDLTAGRVIRRIEGLREPQGVAYAPAADVLALANAGDGSVRLFRGAERPRARSISAMMLITSGLIRAVEIWWSAMAAAAWLLSIPTGATLVSRVPLRAHPEGFQLNPEARRAFVNVPDAQQIAVLDMAAGRQIGTWQIPDHLRANFPMALDPSRTVAAVVFRGPPRLVTFNANTGRPTGNLKSCVDADDAFFDAKRRRVYVSCGAGSVDVWQRDGSALHRLGPFTTASDARASLFVPELDRLFVAAPAGFFGPGSDAAILALRPGN